MRILVFGATGATGAHIVEQGLIRGDEITAFVRQGEHIEPSSRLSVIEADVLDAAAVHAVIPGHHAVIVALESSGHQPADLLGRAVVDIISAMHESNVRRIVALSVAGASDRGEALAHLTLADRVMMRTAASTVLRGALADALAMERALEESDLNYTIVRPARLSDAPRSGSYRVELGALPAHATSVPRGDVAEFMLMQLDSELYARKSPYLGA